MKAALLDKFKQMPEADADPMVPAFNAAKLEKATTTYKFTTSVVALDVAGVGCHGLPISMQNLKNQAHHKQKNNLGAGDREWGKKGRGRGRGLRY